MTGFREIQQLKCLFPGAHQPDGSKAFRVRSCLFHIHRIRLDLDSAGNWVEFSVLTIQVLKPLMHMVRLKNIFRVGGMILLYSNLVYMN